MAIEDYQWDPRMAFDENKIEDEIHTVDTNVDISVWPENGPFYKDDFVLETLSNGVWEEMTLNVDYVFSPMYAKATASTGREIFSYILLVRHHTQVRMSYHTIGKYTDRDLIDEVAGKQFDRSKMYEWMKIRGGYRNTMAIARDPDLRELSIKELLVEQLQGISDSLKNPNNKIAVGSLLSKITQLQVRIGELEQVDDYLALRDSPDIEELVAAGSQKQIFNLKDPRTVYSGCAVFTSSDGTIKESQELKIVRTDTHAFISTYGILSNELLPIMDFTTLEVGDDTRLNVTAKYDGKVQLKIYTQF